MNRIAFHAGRWAAVGVLCAGLGLTLPAFAQSSAGQQGQSSQSSSQPSASSGQRSSNPNQRAVDFFNTMNQTEIQTAKTMENKAENGQVKDYAKMLQDDHEKAQDQLQDAASKLNLQLNTNSKMEAAGKELDSRLQNASGMRADHEFLHAEARDHAHAIRRARTLEKEVTDPGLKDYIAAIIPVLKKHMHQAHSLMASLGGHAAGTPASKSSSSQTPPSSKNPPRR